MNKYHFTWGDGRPQDFFRMGDQLIAVPSEEDKIYGENDAYKKDLAIEREGFRGTINLYYTSRSGKSGGGHLTTPYCLERPDFTFRYDTRVGEISQSPAMKSKMHRAPYKDTFFIVGYSNPDSWNRDASPRPFWVKLIKRTDKLSYGGDEFNFFFRAASTKAKIEENATATSHAHSWNVYGQHVTFHCDYDTEDIDTAILKKFLQVLLYDFCMADIEKSEVLQLIGHDIYHIKNVIFVPTKYGLQRVGPVEELTFQETFFGTTIYAEGIQGDYRYIAEMGGKYYEYCNEVLSLKEAFVAMKKKFDEDEKNKIDISDIADDVMISLADSYAVGNCESGTASFVKRFFPELSQKNNITLGELKAHKSWEKVAKNNQFLRVIQYAARPKEGTQ